ncbi:hypothetical protein BLNAU_18975 [Blattamonas nauphoetae]|uniref:Uncharacterized protein n=1 Tax=Blattamonas nauphoetae TaxID=2049346 RepID=A0ABQ9X2Z5_9EUKA|nr:hypothetical protein BLNAU_18975 [Blattamonas nauphoetae]
MFEYSFGLQTQEVVELLTFKPFELQLLITNSSDIVAGIHQLVRSHFRVYARARQNKRSKTYKTDLLNNNSFLSILLTQRSLRPTLAPDFTTLLICVSASKLATDLDWNQVFRPHLLLSPPYKGSRLSLLFQLAAHCHPSLPLLPFSTHLQRRLANKVCGAGDVDLCVLTLSSLLTNTHVAVPSSTRNQVKAVGVLSTRKRRETRKSVSARAKEQADDDNELFQSFLTDGNPGRMEGTDVFMVEEGEWEEKEDGEEEASGEGERAKEEPQQQEQEGEG